MEDLCDVLRSSEVCIGVSSGPMHLASLCLCKHVVWTDLKHQKAINGTNKDRYKTIWNPFQTKVKVIDKYGWLPPVDEIYKAVRKML